MPDASNSTARRFFTTGARSLGDVLLAGGVDPGREADAHLARLLSVERMGVLTRWCGIGKALFMHQLGPRSMEVLARRMAGRYQRVARFGYDGRWLASLAIDSDALLALHRVWAAGGWAGGRVEFLMYSGIFEHPACSPELVRDWPIGAYQLVLGRPLKYATVTCSGDHCAYWRRLKWTPEPRNWFLEADANWGAGVAGKVLLVSAGTPETLPASSLIRELNQYKRFPLEFWQRAADNQLSGGPSPLTVAESITQRCAAPGAAEVAAYLFGDGIELDDAVLLSRQIAA